MIWIRLGGLGTAAALAAGAAQAHSPYLLPNAFDLTDRDHVTVQGSFTEHFFTPDIVMKSDDYHAVGPDGARIGVTPTYLTDLAIFELPTKDKGTWRITSGARVGRTAKAMLVKGDWVFLEPDKPVPAGARPVDMQSLTKAEVYVSRGAPNDTALAPTGQGLEFHALTHPDSIFVGEPARFEVLFDGKPLAGQAIAVHKADEGEADKARTIDVVSDAAGRFAIKVDRPGVFLAMTRYRVALPGGVAGQSMTYALTFEATQ